MTTLTMLGRPVHMWATNKFSMQMLEDIIRDPTLPTSIAVVGNSTNTIAISVYNRGETCWLQLYKGTAILVSPASELPEWFPEDARYIQQVDFSYIELFMYMGATGNIVLADTDRRILVDPELILQVGKKLGGLQHEAT